MEKRFVPGCKNNGLKSQSALKAGACVMTWLVTTTVKEGLHL